MKKIIPGVIVFAVVAVISLHLGCQRKASGEIDAGRIENNTYSNAFFGMKMDIPADWSIQSDQTMAEITKEGIELMSNDDREARQTTRLTEMNVVNLFGISRYPMGAPVDFNHNIICLAERLRLPGVTSGKDYLFHTRRQLEASALAIAFTGEPKQLTLGGVDFDVIESAIQIAGMQVNQRLYASVMNSYALVLTLSYQGEAQLAELEGILSTVAFD